MANIVKFLKFSGRESEWEAKLKANVYENYVVFAKIWSVDNTCRHVIYAGNDSHGNQYMYNLTTQTDVGEILKLLARANGKFTNEEFINGIEEIINGSQTINEIKQSIQWNTID